MHNKEPETFENGEQPQGSSSSNTPERLWGEDERLSVLAAEIELFELKLSEEEWDSYFGSVAENSPSFRLASMP